jgi:hypothetical protein
MSAASFVGIELLISEIIPSYGGGVAVFQILVVSMFFMPQVSTLRLPLMYDKDLRQIGYSNGIAVVAAAALFGGVLLGAEERTLRLVAIVMVLAHLVYFAYLMAVVGRRSWGAAKAVENLLTVLAAAAWTAWVLDRFGTAGRDFDGVFDHLAWSAAALAQMLGMLAPVILFGAWRSGLLRLLRGRPPGFAQ